MRELRRLEQGRLTPSEQLDRSFDYEKAWTEARAAVDAWAAAGYPDPEPNQESVNDPGLKAGASTERRKAHVDQE
jgi:hypothetical protein